MLRSWKNTGLKACASCTQQVCRHVQDRRASYREIHEIAAERVLHVVQVESQMELKRAAGRNGCRSGPRADDAMRWNRIFTIGGRTRKDDPAIQSDARVQQFRVVVVRPCVSSIVTHLQLDHPGVVERSHVRDRPCLRNLFLRIQGTRELHGNFRGVVHCDSDDSRPFWNRSIVAVQRARDMCTNSRSRLLVFHDPWSGTCDDKLTFCVFRSRLG